ncbi:hypothetical protein K2X30_01515 [bacterium]|jgi:DNA-binding protein H-NS|nr:hypothetical protein [bacterium]
MSKKSGFPIKIPSAKVDDQPATRKMLRLVRDELRSEIRQLDRKMDTKFQEFEVKMDARFAGQDSKFTGYFEALKADSTRMQLLLEEQNANNRIVLEGLQALWQRQDRIEKRL